MSEINNRKQRIIEAAIEVLKENTIEETTVRKIASKAGLTTGSLYHHYANKDEILFDVMKQSLQFTHKIIDRMKNGTKSKKGQELLSEITTEVAKRLSKQDEQKLHLLLLNDVIARNSEIKGKYQTNYTEIIDNTANLFCDAFELESKGYNKEVASILLAAIDGIAIQQALGIMPEEITKMTEIFNSFFAESIPLFLKNHKK